jgi:hypothetical protein
MASVMAVEIVPRHGPQVVYPADCRVTILVCADRGGGHLRIQDLLGVVFSALEFGDDDGPLRLALLGIVEAVVHSFRFDEQHLVHGLAAGSLEVRRLIDPGVAIPHPAKPLHNPFHLIPWDVRRPLEIHVLDPMRDTRLTWAFVSRTNSVPTPNRNEWRGVEFPYEHLQPVVQLEIADTVVDRSVVREGHDVHYTSRFLATAVANAPNFKPFQPYALASSLHWLCQATGLTQAQPWTAPPHCRCGGFERRTTMLKRSFLALVASALLPIGAAAQENATVTLKSGEKLNAQVVDLGGGGFALRVNGQDRQVPKGEVAVIDFTNSEMTEADWGKFTSGQTTVLLRNGETITGDLYDIGGTRPLKIIFKTASGDRELSSNEIGRIVLGRPSNAAVATSGSAQVPDGQGIAVPGNQRWTSTGLTDAADVAHATGSVSQRYAPNSPLPRVFAGALIGRVGNGEPFAIGGPTNTVTIPADGQLFLGINDDEVSDNQGGFRVNIQRSGRRR